MAGTGIDIFVAYKFIKQLSKPWDQWEAYKLGLIDKKGAKIKKAETKKEKKAYPMWKILVRNIKRLLEKLPGGSSKLASFAVALWMIKEEMEIKDITILEAEFEKYIDTHPILIENAESPKKINTLEKGRYIHKATGNAIFLRENVDPVGEVFDAQIFKLADYISGREYTVTLEELETF